MNYLHIKGLFIDIDDTIVRFKRGAAETDGSEPKTGSLLRVLQRAGVELGGLSPEEAARRIHRTQTELRWWHWSDFIVALGLQPKEFWHYALEMERRYLEPTGPEMREALERLHRAGILLYITSNNPSSGILHKLNVAGIATVNGSTLFSQLLGATELQAMKSDPLYWRKALAHIGLNANEVAVVGDNLHDDCAVPHSVGISHAFLVDRTRDRSEENTPVLTYVRDFAALGNLILGASASPTASR